MSHASPEPFPTYPAPEDVAVVVEQEPAVDPLLAEPAAAVEVDTRPTLIEAFRSINGFDEIAVRQFFDGKDPAGLDGGAFARSIAFILLRRDGEDDRNAYNRVMALTTGALDDMFRPDEDPEGKAPSA